MAVNMLSFLKTSLIRIESRLLCALGVNNQGHWPDGLAVDMASPSPTSNAGSSNQSSLLDTLLGDGFLWMAVPKRRVSMERRMKRRMAPQRIKKWATPRQNIIECLDCGHWHMAHTICGNCYEKVRAETEEMRQAMGHHDRLHNAPRSEVQYIYQGEEDARPTHNGKYIVEMEKPRPEWWPKNLLAKSSSRR